MRITWVSVLVVLISFVRVQAEEPGIEMTAIYREGSGIRVSVRYPYGFTNGLDFFAGTNLVCGDWVMIAHDAATGGTNVLSWLDSTGGGYRARFYLVGDAGVDGDSDGIPDARESLVYRTNPVMPDTDSDGVPDGAELQRGTDPVNGGSRVLTLYVNSDFGNDSYDGLAGVVGEGHGPKRSIGAAYGGAFEQDTITLQGESVFEEPWLCLGGRSVVLCPRGDITVRP